MRVLSLFDGISCGQVALERLGIKPEYYSSEIDKYAIAVTQYRYPNTIQLGDIRFWKQWNIDWNFDLVMGGSPCQGFSFAGKQLNFNDPRSKLFFVFVDILNHVKKFNPNVKFLLENVRMKREYQDVISDILGVKPMMINSALVSAQNRIRLYWFNWEVEQPENRSILLKDILENVVVDRDKSYCIDANYYKGASWKQYKTKSRRQLVKIGQFGSGGQGDRIYSVEGKSVALSANGGGRGAKTGLYAVALRNRGHGKKPEYNRSGKANALTTVQTDSMIGNDFIIRKLTPLECERLQTLPDNYTLVPHPVYKGKMMSNTQRYKMLGNGWTVEVIKHILSGII